MITQTQKEITFHPRWGGYDNLPPVPGHPGKRYWARASGLAKILDDTYNLDQWRLRQVVEGIRLQPDVLNFISGRHEPSSFAGKAERGTVASRALELAGSLDGADAGTELHDICERGDRGEAVPGLSGDQQATLSAYAAMLDASGVRVLPQYMERVVVNPALDVAGRLDRIVTSSAGQPRIMDLKSQKWEPGVYDGMALAIQLAVYASASHMLNEETWTWEAMPLVSQTGGLIFWIPATQPGTCKIYDVDLAMGLTLARAARKVKEWRYSKGIVTPYSHP